ncbi:hypothetical protein ACFX5F_05150 [Flavobacterium sp. ZS1P70]|uniref:Uncharacterized protein n=1 Tax=Flavobacterium zhoui TaxID=3230414 RepID=A0ABW6I2W2_9FLAO
MENEKHVQLSKGMTYVLSADFSSHDSLATNGVQLLIIDGDFLK